MATEYRTLINAGRQTVDVAEAFDAAVTKYLRDGWQLHGPQTFIELQDNRHSQGYTLLSQAMVREIPEEQNAQ